MLKYLRNSSPQLIGICFQCRSKSKLIYPKLLTTFWPASIFKLKCDQIRFLLIFVCGVVDFLRSLSQSFLYIYSSSTFVCPTEIIAFSDRSDEFRQRGCELVACSTDSVYSHIAWINTSRKEGGIGEMKIPIMADKTMQISRDYGVLCEKEGIAFRGIFIIDGKGILRQITINDLPVGRSVDEALRLVDAFQFTDQHGEVCPANWKPGQKAMKATSGGLKTFMGENHK